MSRQCALSKKSPLFGHRVSHANNKTKHRFLPNVHDVTVYSHVLKNYVPLKLSAHAMRTLDKHGGLDHYVASTSLSKLPQDKIIRVIKKKLLEQKASEKK